MNSPRSSSLAPVSINGWRWRPFLDKTIDVLSHLNPEPYPISKEFLDKEGITAVKGSNLKVNAQTWGCSTSRLKQVRAACLEAGKAASVLNLLIRPLHKYDLPFFGADFVTLSSGHLLALDLQPVLKDDKLHTEAIWEKLLPVHKKWQQLLPDGGPIPKESESYFSPAFLWTRLPLGKEGDTYIEQVIEPAFNEYLSVYVDLLNNSKTINLERSKQLLVGQSNYLKYRAKKDPARGMLTRLFGRQWTEEYIHHVLFEL